MTVQNILVFLNGAETSRRSRHWHFNPVHFLNFSETILSQAASVYTHELLHVIEQKVRRNFLESGAITIFFCRCVKHLPHTQACLRSQGRPLTKPR